MDQKEFEKEMALFQDATQKIISPTAAAKRQTLAQRSEEKRARLGKPIQDTINIVNDADTFNLQNLGPTRLQGQNGVGYDAYEVNHGDWNPSNNERATLARQQQRLAQERGIDPSQVTKEDVNAAGAREGLMALYNAMGRPVGEDGKEWTPGPTDYYGTHPFQLGSKENPLGIPVEATPSGQSTYGRNVASVKGANNVPVEQGIINENNVAMFDPKTGKYDAQNTELQKAAMAGIVTPEQASAGFDNLPFEKQMEIMDYSTKSGRFRNEGMLSEAVDMGQSALTGIAADTINTADKLTKDTWLRNKYEDIFGKGGMTYDEGGKDFLGSGKNIQDFRGDTGTNARDAFTGVAPEARKEFSRAQQGAIKDIKNGDYGSAAWKTVKVLPYMLAESAPEMAMILTAPGMATTIANRVSNTAEKYEKNNGKPMSFEDMAKTGAWEAANLYAEKFILKSGAHGAIEKAFMPSGKSLKSRVGRGALGTAGSAAFEGAQEMSENLSETYMGQKEGERTAMDILSSPESIYSGMAGGLMGGALRGGGEAAVGATRIPGTIAANNERKAQENVGEYIVGNDGQFVDALNEMTLNEATTQKKQLDQAKEILENATSYEELKKSTNPHVREAIAGIEQDVAQTVVPGTDAYKQAVGQFIEKVQNDIKEGNIAPEELNGVNDILGVDVQTVKDPNDYVANMTPEMEQRIAENIPNEFMQNVVAENIATKKFGDVKNAIGSVIDGRSKIAEQEIKTKDTVLKNYNKGKEKRPENLKDEPVDTKKIASESLDQGWLGKVKDIVTLNNTPKKKAMAHLNQYTDEALNKAKEELTSKKDKTKEDREILKYIKETQKAREDAKKKIKLDQNKYVSPRDNEFAKGNKRKTINAIKEALQVKELVDTRDVEAVDKLIDSALEQGFITENQRDILKRRLEKVGSNAKAPTEEQLKKEEEAKQKKTEETGMPKESQSDIIERTPENIKEEHAAIVRELKKISSEVDLLNSKEEKTKEDEAAIEKLRQKVNKLVSRSQKLSSMYLDYTQHEMEMNEKYGPFENIKDSIFKNAVEYDTKVENIFTEEEKKILNLC